MDTDGFLVADVKSRNANVYKDLAKKHPKKIILIAPEMEKLERMKKEKHRTAITPEVFEQIRELCLKIRALDDFISYVEKGKREQAFFGEIEGVPVKCRIDILRFETKKRVRVLDPKTTDKENTRAVFTQSTANNYYYLQEYLYTEILKQNGFEVEDYSFVQASTQPYSGAGYYKHDEDFMYQAEIDFQKAITKYKACLRLGSFPESGFNYETEEFDIVTDVSPPAYLQYRNA